ncbi:MAG: hypothetical protein K6G33_10075 [Ruminococcus sp.]|uniref:hypothetical protein n=1 Tax=Ruminococcus sp. TaxID=41978 RepID=UPI0025F8ADCC|nr:hypothetical protein [Ruminococcus sp.]MCR5601070.1 hypothetical protein [Ruminococcus sp.]
MKKSVFVLMSALFMTCTITYDLCGNGLYAFAADNSKSSGLSKGTVIAVMIAVFILSAAVAGIVTFKIRVKNRDISNDKSPTDKK